MECFSAIPIQSGNSVPKDCRYEKNAGLWIVIQNIADGEKIQVSLKNVNAEFLIITGTEKMSVADDSACIAVKEFDTDGTESWIILSLGEFGQKSVCNRISGTEAKKAYYNRGMHRCSHEAWKLIGNTHIKSTATAESLEKLNMKRSLPNHGEYERKKTSTLDAMSLISFNPPRAKLEGCERIGIATRCLNSLHSILLVGLQKSLRLTSSKDSRILADGADETSLLRWISLDNSTKKPKPISVDRKCKDNAGKHLDGKIRVEINVDKYGMGRKKQLILHELDSIKIKLTTFSLQFVPQKMEIDFVKSFTCESETDRCRRMISKVLKRDIVTNFNWEKGLNARGMRFSIHWNNFQIPILSTADDEFKTFKVSNTEYELRIRFFTDGNIGKADCTACSFPVRVVRVI